MAARAVNFFKEYDLLLSPATIVEPFAVQDRYVTGSSTMWIGSRSPLQSLWRVVQHYLCPAASLALACRSGCRWSPRLALRASYWLPPKCWRIFRACGKTHPSTQGHQREGCHSTWPSRYLPRCAFRLSTGRSKSSIRRNSFDARIEMTFTGIHRAGTDSGAAESKMHNPPGQEPTGDRLCGPR